MGPDPKLQTYSSLDRIYRAPASPIVNLRSFVTRPSYVVIAFLYQRCASHGIGLKPLLYSFVLQSFWTAPTDWTSPDQLRVSWTRILKPSVHVARMMKRPDGINEN